MSLGGYASASSTQDASAIMMIRCLYSVVPIILMFVVIFCATQFGKLSKMMPEIEKELEERKASAT